MDSFLIQTNNARSTPAYGDDFLCQIRPTFTIRPNSIRRLHSPHITKTFLHVLFVCTYHFSTADIRLFNGGLVPALSYYFLTQNPIFMTFDDTNPKLHHGPLPWSKFEANLLSTSRVIAIYSWFRSICGGFMSIMTSFSDSESEIFDFWWY